MESVVISLPELLPVLQELPRADKLRVVQFLVFELAREEGVSLFDFGATYPIWTPYYAFEAADTLLSALAMDQASNHG